MDLVYKNEKVLFAISAIISGLVWALLIAGTIGIALIFLLLAYLFFLFVHSAFISHLKGTGVKLSEEQFPDLHRKFIESCERVGIVKIPEVYLLRMDFFNALATRFLRKNYVVLFTDVVDALKSQPNAIDFYIGHELGHIHRNHLKWNAFIAPAAVLPLLGAALRRAEEYTCDRYGAACCRDEDDIKAAIAAIAAGDTRWDSINIDAYIDQSKNTKEFWMSYNELTGDYPWLTKRMAASIAFKRGQSIKGPGRHFFAWLLAAITPRFAPGGGVASLLVTVAIIGILAAVALPAYQDYTFRVQYAAAYAAGLDVQAAASEYALANQALPTSVEDLGLTTADISNSAIGYTVDVYEDGIIGVQVGTDNTGEGRFIVIEPVITEGTLSWVCYGQNVDVQHLPPACQ